jgi:hypothetical protein
MPRETPVEHMAQVIDWFSAPQMRYPNSYVWFIFFSAMDIMLTWKILEKDGEEVNPVADLVITYWGLWGAIGFKFALALFVVVTCEIVGRRRPRTGLALAAVAVAIAASPVAYSLVLLLYHRMIGTI